MLKRGLSTFKQAYIVDLRFIFNCFTINSKKATNFSLKSRL